MVDVTIENLSSYLVQHVSRFKQELPSHIYNYLISRETDIDREYRLGYDQSGLMVRKGDLKNATNLSFFREMDGAGVVVGNQLDYASYMEFGTRPHIITPKNSKYLHFFIGGEEIFTTRVFHPGTKAYGFMDKGTDLTVKMLESGIGKYLQNAFART